MLDWLQQNLSFVIWGIALATLITWSGLGLYWLWLRTRPRSPFPDYRFPHLPSPKIAELEFGRIQYVDVGSGPVILLVHGLGASSFCWRMLIPLLKKKFRVVAPDLIGFGLSDKPLHLDYGLDAQTMRLETFVDHLKLTDINIVGSSMGGLLGLWLALKAPEKVRRVVALSPALNPKLFPFNPAPLNLLSEWSAQRLNEIWIRRILSRVLVKHLDLLPDEVEAYLKPYQRQPDAIRSFIMSLNTVRDKRIPSQLKSLKVPVLILHGEVDRVIPLRVSRGALKHLPKADLKVLKQAGHHLQEDNPQWVFEKICEFI